MIYTIMDARRSSLLQPAPAITSPAAVQHGLHHE